jgi:parallel beta-helix repeat protein
VYLRGGTYPLSGTQWLYASGTASAHILFRPYQNEAVTLDGSRLPANTDAVGVSGRYLDLVGFKVQGSGHDGVTVSGQYVTLQNLEVSYAAHNGIAVWGGSHVQVLANDVHDNQYFGLFSGYDTPWVVSDIRLDGNTVFHNALTNADRKMTGGWPAAVGGKWVSGYTITNNVVYDNYGEGIIFTLADQGLASGNTLHDNYSVELYLDNATHVTLQGNFAYTTRDANYFRTWPSGVTGPATGIQVANERYNGSNPCDHDTVINNIEVGGTWGFNYGNYKNGGGLKDFLIANNTFYSASRSVLSIDQDAGHSNTVFADNIFDQTGGGAMVQFNGSLGFGNLSFFTNLWFGGSAGPAAGAGDVNADPRLAGPGSASPGGYQLTAGSPAIDAGTTLAAVTTDFFGTPRPQGRGYDIGAVEFIPPPAAPAAPGSPSAATAGARPALPAGAAALGERLGGADPGVGAFLFGAGGVKARRATEPDTLAGV